MRLIVTELLHLSGSHHRDSHEITPSYDLVPQVVVVVEELDLVPVAMNLTDLCLEGAWEGEAPEKVELLDGVSFPNRGLDHVVSPTTTARKNYVHVRVDEKACGVTKKSLQTHSLVHRVLFRQQDWVDEKQRQFQHCIISALLLSLAELIIHLCRLALF